MLHENRSRTYREVIRTSNRHFFILRRVLLTAVERLQSLQSISTNQVSELTDVSGGRCTLPLTGAFTVRLWQIREEEEEVG